MTVGSSVKSCYFSVKSAEANVEQLIHKTTSKQSKAVFEEARQLLQEVKTDLHQQVLFLAKEEPQY
jgi:hypothetical protein